jgi:hypothetical protein
MGVVWGSERDQQDLALLSLNIFERRPIERFNVSPDLVLVNHRNP